MEKINDNYKIIDETVIVTVSSKRHTNIEYILDLEDFNKIEALNKRIFIHENKKFNKLYGAISINGKNIYLHRFVTNCPNGLVVDHINHNECDNRKSNLRVCTTAENMRNRKSYQSNNKLKLLGVSMSNSNKNGYLSQIRIDSKTYNLGIYFKSENAYITHNIANEIILNKSFIPLREMMYNYEKLQIDHDKILAENQKLREDLKESGIYQNGLIKGANSLREEKDRYKTALDHAMEKIEKMKADCENCKQELQEESKG